MESPEVTRFRACVLEGHWPEAEECLTGLGVTEDVDLRVSIASNARYQELTKKTIGIPLPY